MFLYVDTLSNYANCRNMQFLVLNTYSLSPISWYNCYWGSEGYVQKLNSSKEKKILFRVNLHFTGYQRDIQLCLKKLTRMYLLCYLKTDQDVLVILSENWPRCTCNSIWKLTKMYLLFYLKTDQDVLVILSEKWRGCTCYSIWKLARMYLLLCLKTDEDVLFILSENWRGSTCLFIWKLTRKYILFYLKTDKDILVILKKLTRMYLLFYLKTDEEVLVILSENWRKSTCYSI